jgi:hypothetical protein
MGMLLQAAAGGAKGFTDVVNKNYDSNIQAVRDKRLGEIRQGNWKERNDITQTNNEKNYNTKRTDELTDATNSAVAARQKEDRDFANRKNLERLKDTLKNANSIPENLKSVYDGKIKRYEALSKNGDLGEGGGDSAEFKSLQNDIAGLESQILGGKSPTTTKPVVTDGSGGEQKTDISIDEIRSRLQNIGSGNDINQAQSGGGANAAQPTEAVQPQEQAYQPNSKEGLLSLAESNSDKDIMDTVTGTLTAAKDNVVQTGKDFMDWREKEFIEDKVTRAKEMLRSDSLSTGDKNFIMNVFGQGDLSGDEVGRVADQLEAAGMSKEEVQDLIMLRHQIMSTQK